MGDSGWGPMDPAVLSTFFVEPVSISRSGFDGGLTVIRMRYGFHDAKVAPEKQIAYCGDCHAAMRVMHGAGDLHFRPCFRWSSDFTTKTRAT